LYKTETHPRECNTTVVIRYKRNAGTAASGLVALEVGKITPLEPQGAMLFMNVEHRQLVLKAPAGEEVNKWVIHLFGGGVVAA